MLFILQIKIYTYPNIKISRCHNCENTQSRQKEGRRDGPGGKPLPPKAWGPEFGPQKPGEKLGLVTYTCIDSRDKRGVGDMLVPGQLVKAIWRSAKPIRNPFVKQKTEGTWEIRHTSLSFHLHMHVSTVQPLLYERTCMHNQAYANMCAHMTQTTGHLLQVLPDSSWLA